MLPFAFQFKQADAPAVNVISLIPHMGYRFLNVTRQHSATHLLCTMISDDLELVQKASFHVAWVVAGPRTRLNQAILSTEGLEGLRRRQALSAV